MSTHNIGFHEDLTKIYFNYHQISSNMHIISSPEFLWFLITILKVLYFPCVMFIFSEDDISWLLNLKIEFLQIALYFKK